MNYTIKSRNVKYHTEKIADVCQYFILFAFHAQRKDRGAEPRSFWYSRWESNPELPLRRGLLYPFNYGSAFI